MRIDSGVDDGYEVPSYYDSLIAKLITWGQDREEAVQRMRRALTEYCIHGIKTTIPFHRRVMADADFLRGDVDTTYIDRRFPDRPHAWDESKREIAVVAAAIHAFLQERARPQPAVSASQPAVSTWTLAARQAGLRR